ncbi:MAG: toll/interleukin-1 receptor domain-containing protein [Acidobacteria bacterium]|nr:toll/interleukin-1 receptor domain-containing protein [Acidobacteriota bacterium]MYE44577.1 toll/interleukin-1 receptor domain-containing protein [Acidobacteriota bacterium]
MSAKTYILPSKIPVYLRRLQSQYKKRGKTTLDALVSTSYFRVSKEPIYDGFAETYDHEVDAFVPFELLATIDIAEQKEIEDELCSGFNTLCRAIADETVASVNILDEAEDRDDSRQTSYRVHQRVSDATVPDLWSGGGLRLFISHRDKHKARAHEIADALGDFGIVSFVAHDNIAPMSEWKDQIIKALASCEAMLILLTDDFAESVWTNQEIGFALARGIPIIPLSLDGTAPPGFVSERQAARFTDATKQSVKDLYRLITTAVGAEGRMRESLVRALVESRDFYDARDRFNRLKLIARELTEEEERMLVDGYNRNSQLNRSIYLGNNYRRFEKFLQTLTGKPYSVVSGRVSVQHEETNTDDVPF